MRAAVFAAKIALGLLLLAGGSLHAEDWPMDGRDLHHSFSNPQSGINPGNVAKLQSPDDSQMETPLSRTYILEILGVAAIRYLIGLLRVLIFLPIQQMVRVSLRTVTMQIPSQKIITMDNVSIDIAAVAYYHISDPERAVIVIENVYNAINQISQTTVRNVVGRFSLDQLLLDTAGINLQIKNVIDGHTEPWGTKVTAVEIKDIVLPDNMQRAMAKEAEDDGAGSRPPIVEGFSYCGAEFVTGSAAATACRPGRRTRRSTWGKSKTHRTCPKDGEHLRSREDSNETGC
jgi:hypothetical protein